MIERVEAWSYADAEPGGSLPVQIAAELAHLASNAPNQGLRRGLRRAQDALDDGLSAEAVAAELYRVRDEINRRED